MEMEIQRNHAGRKAHCNLCGPEMAEGSLRLHLERQHNTFFSAVLVTGDKEESKDCTLEVRKDPGSGQ
jgi:hypothetical protein